VTYKSFRFALKSKAEAVTIFHLAHLETTLSPRERENESNLRWNLNPFQLEMIIF